MLNNGLKCFLFLLIIISCLDMFGVGVQLLFFVLSSTLVHCNPGELVIDQDTQDHLDLSDTKVR